MRRLESWLEAVTGSAVSSLRILPGATSSTLWTVHLDNGTQAVVRSFTNRAWLDREPDLALHEAAALEFATTLDLPSPRLIAADADGSRCGSPSVLMTRLPGTVDLPRSPTEKWLAALAGPLEELHTVEPPSAFGWSYDPWIDPDRPIPAWTQDRRLWERAFGRYVNGMPVEDDRFLHRDFHPTNVLWSDGEVSGIVDWVNACVGPPSSDIAHCRLNLALMYGIEMADRFTEVLDRPYDPIWDLAPALSAAPDLEVYPPWHVFGLSLSSAAVRERLEEFVRRAL